MAQKKPKTKKVSKNDTLRAELNVLVKKANKRVNALRNKNINSRALVEAMRTYRRRGDKNESDSQHLQAFYPPASAHGGPARILLSLHADI